MKFSGTWVENEKYVMIQKFHVSSTTGLVNMWYCFVQITFLNKNCGGRNAFRSSYVICLVGHIGTGDETTQKTENMQSYTSTTTSVAKMSAVLTTDNSNKIKQCTLQTEQET